MANPSILFQSESTAKALIAGIPCAARAVLALVTAGKVSPATKIPVVIPDRWSSIGTIEEEVKRLVPDASVEFATIDPAYDSDVIDGFAAATIADISKITTQDRSTVATGFPSAAERKRALAKASKRLIASTGKTTDGLVSRFLNRPISQRMSLVLLRSAQVRPIHATVAAGLIGLVMTSCLFFGGSLGLLAGAVLFQLASIVDGVDGEIARATFRSSNFGATLDTATDAITNFAFIAGVSTNLWLQGDVFAGQAGFGGLILLASGLTLIGVRSLRMGGPLSFDALKHKARGNSSPVMEFLAQVSSRDVYALVLAALIVAGFASQAMIIFASAIALWFVAALVMLARKPA